MDRGYDGLKTMNETRRTRRPLPVAAIRTAFPLLAFLFAAGRMNALETIDLVDHDRTVTFSREILRLVETSTGDVLLERELPVESAVGAGLTQVIDLPDRQVVAVSTGSRIRLLDVTRAPGSGCGCLRRRHRRRSGIDQRPRTCGRDVLHAGVQAL